MCSGDADRAGGQTIMARCRALREPQWQGELGRLLASLARSGRLPGGGRLPVCGLTPPGLGGAPQAKKGRMVRKDVSITS